MEQMRIQITYSDRFGDNAGCTAVNLPVWLEEAPLPKIRGFFKLAARHSAEGENAGAIVKIEAYITKALAEAEVELKVAKMIKEPKTRTAETRRVENWIKRLQGIRKDLAAALDKYNPKRKND